MQKEEPKMDVLQEASRMLSEPSRNTKRKILTGFNFVFILALLLHLVIQLVEFGSLPDPARDLVLFPIIILINSISAIYNVPILLGRRKSVPWMNRFSAWTTIGISLLLAILIVHTNINIATSILIDFGYSVIMIFIVGTVIGRKAAIVWFGIATVSLFVAYQNVGEDFVYYLMTNEEVQVFEDSLAAGNQEAIDRVEKLNAHNLAPVPVKLFAAIWFIFMTTLVLAVYFESNMISKVLGAIPAVIRRISIASEEKNKLEHENMRMGMELDVAHQIQKTLLPKHEEWDEVNYLNISARMDPANEVGGDFYEVLPQDDRSVVVAIGDVTDHGLQSGLVMLMVQSTIRTILDKDGDQTTLMNAMNRINTIMYRNIRNRMHDYRNLTMSLAHVTRNSVTLCGQHENLLRYNARSGSVEVIPTDDLGIYVGLIEDIKPHVSELTVDFFENDVLLFYTDGLTESENQSGQFFGEDRLIQLLKRHSTEEANDIVEIIYDDVYQFIGDTPILDDITLMIIKNKSV
ncbi:PP2C family protein-serine/threonine phosphatase [Membranicola marinus]|uniref:PP2C family protein-serine/threonine phosphatase n=1 Tax=Membranihabitans marinus TaxID=1227546 RepID=A0A953L922_9BACT|nr:PP2C family protein-serine/threonine phosphatase [Membranihabitans marinus]MBY5957178.1 PP2C family protein-serine/threonine phosphatase [Membranihabitans marinus]